MSFQFSFLTILIDKVLKRLLDRVSVLAVLVVLVVWL